MNGIIALKKAREYTDETADSLGSLKGAPATIKSTTETDEGIIITFEWTGTSGATENTSILVKNGEDGQAQTITTSRTADDDGVIITVVNPDGTTASATTIYDGESGEATSIDWNKVENRPFITLSADDFEVDENGTLTVITRGNKIDSISVNGTTLTPDTNKNVDITIPTVSAEFDNQIEQKTDGIYVRDMSAKISAKEGNAVSLETDGLYVPSVSETKVSEVEDNIIEIKQDGIYVAPTDLTNYVEKVDGKGLSTNDLTDEMVEKIGNTYTKDETYSRTEIDDAITNAQLGGEEVDLTVYVKTETLTEELAKYSTTEVSDEKYVLDEEITVLSESDITSLLGLNDTELEGITQLLLDTSTQTNKTWSSSKIYSELNSTLDTAKQYTLDELAKSIGASYKVVDSVDSMTSAKILYLLKDADSGLYNICIYDEDASSAELIGSFEINLDDYLKISDAENIYVKQTDFEPINTQVSAILDGTTVVSKARDAITLNGLTSDDFAKASQVDGKLLGTVNGWTAIQSVNTDGETMYRMQLQQNGNVDLYASTTDGDGNVTWKKTLTLNNAFLPLNGGTVSGKITLSNGTSFTPLESKREQSDGTVYYTQWFMGNGKCALWRLYDENSSELSNITLRNDSILATFGGVSNTVVHSGNIDTTIFAETDYTSNIIKNTDNVQNLWSTSIKKVGNIVSFVANITVNEISSFTAVLGTLPSEATPPSSVSMNTVSNKGEPCYLYINTDGTFGITKNDTSKTWVSGDGIRIIVTYMA